MIFPITKKSIQIIVMRTLFFNANIYTGNPQHAHAEAMLVKDGIIEAIGTYKDIKDLGYTPNKIIDLQNQFVMPGFNDGHIHIWKVGDLKTFMADLRELKSIDDILLKLSHFGKNKSNKEWIMARGFNEANFVEKKMPTKKDLDIQFPHQPVYLIRTCAHIVVVNSKALEIAGINEHTPVPIGGEMLLDEEGKPNGIFTETAKGLFAPYLPIYDAENYTQMIQVATEELLSLGITSATDPAVMPDLLAVYHHLEKNNQLKIRINAIPISIPDGDEKPLPLPEIFRSDFLVVDTLKFFADGGLSGSTAALYRHYKNQPDNFGVLRLTYDLFFPIALNARKKGWRIATHAIGDKALDEVLNVYEDIQSAIPSTICNRIEHVGIADLHQFERIKKLDIGVQTQPIFLNELGENFTACLDTAYLNKCYAFKDMLDMNIKIGFSTDAPVVKEINPFVGIQTAIDRKNKKGNVIGEEQKIDFYAALRAYTIGSAEVQQETDQKGLLSTHQYADFICLDQDITKPIKSLISTRVLQTYVGGNLCYTSTEM